MIAVDLGALLELLGAATVFVDVAPAARLWFDVIGNATDAELVRVLDAFDAAVSVLGDEQRSALSDAVVSLAQQRAVEAERLRQHAVARETERSAFVVGRLGAGRR